MEKEKRDAIRFGVDEIAIEIVSEPYVVNTYHGFAPVVDAKLEDKQEVKIMYIGAKSLADPLSQMLKQNKGKFTGLKLKIKKESNDNRAPYIVK
ncbi:MAG: hypothetical protein JW983_04780 [Elusimicrobia bacterium]|nr:hypothetical protein [Elusimicrobiota bacterium]